MPNLIHLCCSHQRICWYNFEACSYCQDAATVMQTAGVRLCHNAIVSFLPCNTRISLWHQPGIFKTKIIVGIYKAIATWRNCGPQNRALVLGIITYKTVKSWSHSNNYHKLWWQVCCCTSLGSNHHLSGERWWHLPKSSQLHTVGCWCSENSSEQHEADAVPISASPPTDSFQGKFGADEVCKALLQRWGRSTAEGLLASPGVMKHRFGCGFFSPSDASLKDTCPCPERGKDSAQWGFSSFPAPHLETFNSFHALYRAPWFILAGSQTRHQY